LFNSYLAIYYSIALYCILSGGYIAPYCTCTAAMLSLMPLMHAVHPFIIIFTEHSIITQTVSSLLLSDNLLIVSIYL